MYMEIILKPIEGQENTWRNKLVVSPKLIY